MIRLLNKVWTSLELFYLRYIYEKIIIRKQTRDFLYVMFGPIYFQALSSAVRFDLFSLLYEHKKLTLLQISDHLHLEEKPTRILLSTLTALGFIKRKEKSGSGDVYYKNSFTSNIYLTQGKKYSLIPIIEWYHHIVYKPMFHFYESLKENKNIGLKEFKGEDPTLYQRLTYYPELESIFQAAMQQISVQANIILAKYVDFSGVKHVLDIGGGNGSNLLAITKANPHIYGTVLDSPSVCEIARKNIQEHQMSDRIDAMEGDCFISDFPKNVDCILFSHFLDIWSEEQNKFLIKKSLDSLSPGNPVIIFDIMEWDNMSGPLTAVAGSPYFLTLATGDGYIYSANEYEMWFKDAGAKETKRLNLPQDHVAVIGIK